MEILLTKWFEESDRDLVAGKLEIHAVSREI